MGKHKLHIIAFISAVFLLTGTQSFSQKAFYFGADVSVNVGDTVIVRLHDYEGELQWQKSIKPEGQHNWEYITDATADTLVFVADTTTYFRAHLFAGHCDTLYSDITKIDVYKLKEEVEMIDEEQFVLKSDSLEIADGIFRFSGNIKDLNIEVGSVIIGNENEGFLRKVTSISSHKSEEIVLQTTEAALEDVFEDLDLSDSLIISMDASKTYMKGARALPLHIEYLVPGAEFKSGKSGIDFSGTVLLANPNIEIGFEEGSINFSPSIERRINFKTFWGVPTRLNSMTIQTNGMIDADMKVYVKTNGAYSYSRSFLLARARTAIAIGPVPATITLSFYLGFNADMEAEIYVTAGFESNYNVKAGSKYHHSSGWDNIWNSNSNFTPHEPEFDFMGTVDVKAYLKPEVDFRIAGVAGPNISIDPYLRFSGAMDFPDWGWEMGAGIGGHLGFRVKIFSFSLADFSTELFVWDRVLASYSTELEPLPEVNSLEVVDVTHNIARVKGETVFEGASEITERGILWSKSAHSLMLDNCDGYSIRGDGLGEYLCTALLLDYSTTYYVRAYAKNNEGVGYGDIIEFRTTTHPGKLGSGVTDIEGNYYNTIIVEDLEWMASNLKTTTYNDGTSIPNVEDYDEWFNLSSGAYVWYDNDETNRDKYGAMYNYYAFDSGKLCPDGWRASTFEDWAVLLGAADSQYDINDPHWYSGQSSYGYDVGINLKTKLGWEGPADHDPLNGTDKIGFSGLPGGYRLPDNDFPNTMSWGRWWAVEYSGYTFGWTIQAGSDKMIRFPRPEETGSYVRCVRDYITTYSLDIAMEPQNAGQVSGAGDYPAGDTVMVSAIANSGFEFVNWTDMSGNPISTEATFEYVMPSNDVTIYANFDTELSTLTLVSEPARAGSLKGAGAYEQGDVIALNAMPRSCFDFAKWTDIEGNELSTAVGFNYTMPSGNDTLIAHFAVKPAGTPGEGVYDIEGNYYESVCIGGVEWMAENHRTSRYSDGSVIPTGLSDDEWSNVNQNELGAYAIYPHQDVDGIDSDSEMVETYGKLYNFYTVMDDRGVCPAGWDVASMWTSHGNEWYGMTEYLMEEYDHTNDYNDLNSVGNVLKSCRQVNHPAGGECSTSSHPRWDESPDSLYSNDPYGFSALPSGYRDRDGNYKFIGNSAGWWAKTTEVYDSNGYSISGSKLDYFMVGAQYGYPIRCVKRD